MGATLRTYPINKICGKKLWKTQTHFCWRNATRCLDYQNSHSNGRSPEQSLEHYGMSAVIAINSKRAEGIKGLKEILVDAYNAGLNPLGRRAVQRQRAGVD